VITNKKIEQGEHACVKLTVTVEKAAVKKEYDELIDKYSKSVQLKGFRKGKVPAEVLIRKFGPSLMEETAEKIIHKSLEEAFQDMDKQPLPYSVPRLDSEEELKLDGDYTYTVSFDVYPEVSLPDYKGLEYEKMQVSITKDDLARELQALQEQNSLVVDKQDPVIAKGDIVNLNYCELNEAGEELENTSRENFVFEVGTGYNLYKIDDEVLGLKPEEEKVIRKTLPEDFQPAELAGKNLALKVKINSVKEKKLPEINDELAQDISDKYETLEDLKKDIRARLKSFADRKVRENSVSQLLDKVVEAAEIDLPQSMIDRDLDLQWQNLLARFQGNEHFVLEQLKQEGKSKEEFLTEMKPASERRIKLQLLVVKMVETEKIEISDEEKDAQIRKEAEARKVSFEDAKASLSQNNYLEYLTQDMKNEKLYDLILEGAVAKKGKSVKFLDLVQSNY
jgi:trigger factor